MRKTRVHAIVDALPKRIFRGEEVGPTRTEVRKAKRVCVRMRAGMTHATHGDRRRLFDRVEARAVAEGEASAGREVEGGEERGATVIDWGYYFRLALARWWPLLVAVCVGLAAIVWWMQR